MHKVFDLKPLCYQEQKKIIITAAIIFRKEATVSSNDCSTTNYTELLNKMNEDLKYRLTGQHSGWWFSFVGWQLVEHGWRLVVSVGT